MVLARVLEEQAALRRAAQLELQPADLGQLDDRERALRAAGQVDDRRVPVGVPLQLPLYGLSGSQTAPTEPGLIRQICEVPGVAGKPRSSPTYQ